MKIFITGSTDGLGKIAAIELRDNGHEVVLHARHDRRKEDIQQELPWAEQVLVGDLSDIEETKQLAATINKLGPFEAIIHNAGVYRNNRKDVFHVNVIAPYILTALVDRPKRLIYLNSGMHKSGRINLNQMVEGVSYSDSKLLLLLFAQAVARKWSDVYVNSVNPGWVPTKMGGAGAPNDLQKGMETQVWLAESDDPSALVSGKYFYHKQEQNFKQKADDEQLQEEILGVCANYCGIDFPN